MPPFEVKWTAPEFEYRPKSVSWYWISIIVAVIILAIAVWQKNFLFGFFVVLAEILLLTWANREPSLVNFTLTDKGLSVGDHKFYAFTDMESFSSDVSEGEEWPNLFFQFRRRLKPLLRIRVPKNQAVEIEKTLKTILRQTEHERSLLDALEELIGF